MRERERKRERERGRERGRERERKQSGNEMSEWVSLLANSCFSPLNSHIEL